MATDNKWSPEQTILTEASAELQSVKNLFPDGSVVHERIQSALDKIKSVIFNYTL